MRSTTKRFNAILLALLLPVFLFHIPSSVQAASPESSRTIVHLLDYIAQDYSAAVSEGEIINQFEFNEMKEFSTSVMDLSKEVSFKNANDSASIFKQIKELQQAINKKSDQKNVAGLAGSIKASIIRITGIKIAPSHWPDLSNAKQLYQEHCSTCHGESGDGKGALAGGLEPPPTSFHDDKMLGISPFQAFNTIRLGVSGTSMRAFDELSEREAWDLAFYVNTFLYQGEGEKKKNFEEPGRQFSLEEVASLTDRELKENLSGTEDQQQKELASLRLISKTFKPSSSLQLAEQLIREASNHYQQGQAGLARSKALQAYLEGIEPIELQLRATDPHFTLELEEHIAALRKAIESEGTVENVIDKAGAAQQAVTKAASILENNEFSFWLSFFLSASVILREGIEAFLIIVTILGIIRAANVPKAAKWVHLGWITAVVIGVCGWFFTDSLIRIGGAEREILEGSIALFAACLLLYIGFWLHSKSEIGKWNAFVKERVHKLLHGSNMMGLTFFSFVVVFREAFESVLFLSALNLEVEPGNKSAIGFGVLVAFIAVLILSWTFLKYTAKLPIIKLFKFSSVVIAILAIILVGKGVHAIQETGIFSITAFPVNIRLDFFGIYPTMETFLSQLVVLILVVILYQWGQKLSFKTAKVPRKKQNA